MIYPNTDFVKTYDLILNIVRLENIQFISDFSRSQRIKILTTLQNECDDDLASAMMHDRPYSRSLNHCLINLASLSKEKLELTQRQINDVQWRNVNSFVDDLLDYAQCQVFKENGGISDYEDARHLDNSIRYQEAVNDHSSQSA